MGWLKVPDIAKSVLGGVIFGIVGVALPLTMFSGSDQLNTVLSGAGTLGLGLVVATLIAKMFTFAVSQGSGFVGGPIFPSLFIGGTAGVIVHQVIPGVPLGLAFTCLLAAVPGALVAAPFSMVLLAAFLTQVGALQTAPILIAVVTAFLTMEGVKYLLASRPAGPRRRGETGSRGETSDSGLRVRRPVPGDFVAGGAIRACDRTFTGTSGPRGRIAPGNHRKTVKSSAKEIEMVWAIGGAILYFVLIVTLGVMTLRKGHWVIFVIGIFLPFFWLFGAIMPSRRRGY